MAKNKIFVDGDLLAFPAASVAEERIYVVRDSNNNVIAEFEGINDYNNWKMSFEMFGQDIIYDFSGSLEETSKELVIRPKSLAHAKRNFNNTLEEWLSACPEGDVTVYLAPMTGQRNFRHDVALRKPYKGKREGAHRPVYLQELREWAFTLPYTKRATKFESDDLVVGMAHKHGENGYAVQKEKDLYGSYGSWLYYPGKHLEPVWSDPSLIGHLEWEGRNLAGLGRLFTLAQGGIFGDSADNYSGLDGAGPKKAWEVLEKYNHLPVEALPDAVRDVAMLYKEKYGDEYSYIDKNGEPAVASWYDFYVEGIRLAYMLKNRKDYPHEFIDPAKEMV